MKTPCPRHLLLPAPGASLECFQHTGGCSGLCLVKPIVLHFVFPRRPWKSFSWAKLPGQAQLWGYQNPTAWLKKTNQGANNSFVTYVTLLISSLGVVVGAHTLLCPVEKLLAAPMERGLWTARGLLLLTPAPPSSGCPGLGLWRPLDVRVTPCSPDTRQMWHSCRSPVCPPGAGQGQAQPGSYQESEGKPGGSRVKTLHCLPLE